MNVFEFFKPQKSQVNKIRNDAIEENLRHKSLKLTGLWMANLIGPFKMECMKATAKGGACMNVAPGTISSIFTLALALALALAFGIIVLLNRLLKF